MTFKRTGGHCLEEPDTGHGFFPPPVGEPHIICSPQAGGGLLEKLLPPTPGPSSADKRGGSALWAMLSEGGAIPAPTYQGVFFKLKYNIHTVEYTKSLNLMYTAH